MMGAGSAENNMKTTINLLLTALLLALTIACGGGDETQDDCQADLSCTADGSLCAELQLPESFDAQPAMLYVVGFADWPPAGMPDAFLYTGSGAPEFDACGQLELQLEDLTASGELYVAFELLVEGGGTMSPEPGVDYVYFTPEPLSFDGSPLNLGILPLEVYQEGA